MENPESFGVTLVVTGVLEKLNVPYVVGGSMASIIHGMVRTTMDVDITKWGQSLHVSDLLKRALIEGGENRHE